MKKFTLFFFILFACSTIYAQRVTWSFNGSYRTEVEDFGIGTQVTFPIYKGLHIAPTVNYFFGKSSAGSRAGNSLNYGIDLHYIFPTNKAYISPFFGVEGMTNWQNGLILNDHWVKTGEGKYSNFHMLGNFGLTGKWFCGDEGKYFINTQMKYSLFFSDEGSDYASFTAGFGFVF